MTNQTALQVVEPEVLDTEPTALVRQSPLRPDSLMPVFTAEQAIERYRAFVSFVKQALNEGSDFGAIPGTQKKTLFKPGAEKLCTFFGLSVRFELKEAVEDWTGYAHDGEPFFNYRYACSLWRGDQLLAESEASCNSWEKKYRYRQGQAKCPECGVAAIFKSKNQPEWYCWKKKEGCGATFAIDDKRITSQDTSRSPNEDIADQVNTLQKMAQKRALIGSTLIAVNASEFFTQDVEDFMPGVTQPVSESTQPSPPPPRARQRTESQTAEMPPPSSTAPRSQTRDEIMRDKRAQGIAAMGLVTRASEAEFSVQTPSLKGTKVSFIVKRDQNGQVVCSCEEFQDSVIKDKAFRCEHILAVKHALLAKSDSTQQAEKTNAELADERTAAALDRTQLLGAIEDARLKLEAAKVEPGWSIEDFTRYVNEKYDVEKGINDPLLTVSQLTELKAEMWARVDEHFNQQGKATATEFPRDPLAKSLADLVTPKQQGMMRALAREAGVDAEEECQSVLRCKLDELSKKAASSLIDHFKSLAGSRKG